jgi:hypothetical protein
METTAKLQGDIGELIFEHFCQRNQYAYIRLDEIHTTLTHQNKLKFKYGDRRIPVRVPADIADEIREFSRPVNNDELKPNFVFDFLTVSLRTSFRKENDHYKQMPYLTHKAFNWIEIKTGNAKLSKNQKKYKDKSQMGVKLFHISSLFPKRYEVKYETLKSAW